MVKVDKRIHRVFSEMHRVRVRSQRCVSLKAEQGDAKWAFAIPQSVFMPIRRCSHLRNVVFGFHGSSRCCRALILVPCRRGHSRHRKAAKASRDSDRFARSAAVARRRGLRTRESRPRTYRGPNRQTACRSGSALNRSSNRLNGRGSGFRRAEPSFGASAAAAGGAVAARLAARSPRIAALAER